MKGGETIWHIAEVVVVVAIVAVLGSCVVVVVDVDVRVQPGDHTGEELAKGCENEMSETVHQGKRPNFCIQE